VVGRGKGAGGAAEKSHVCVCACSQCVAARGGRGVWWAWGEVWPAPRPV